MRNQWTFADEELAWENEACDSKEEAIREGKKFYGYKDFYVGEIRWNEEYGKYVIPNSTVEKIICK